VDIGEYGSMSDAQIFNDFDLKECLEDKSIVFPELSPISEHDGPMPYFILGDAVFGIRTFLRHMVKRISRGTTGSTTTGSPGVDVWWRMHLESRPRDGKSSSPPCSHAAV